MADRPPGHEACFQIGTLSRETGEFLLSGQTEVRERVVFRSRLDQIWADTNICLLLFLAGNFRQTFQSCDLDVMEIVAPPKSAYCRILSVDNPSYPHRHSSFKEVIRVNEDGTGVVRGLLRDSHLVTNVRMADLLYIVADHKQGIAHSLDMKRCLPESAAVAPKQKKKGPLLW